MVSERIDIINNLIFKNAHAERADGLLHGKMGITIYLYHLGRALKDKKYIILANKLIDQVYDGIGQNSVKTDFENGLAGIAWGIEHLVQKGFLNADTDEVLRDLDDKIFQYISGTQSISIDLKNGLLGYGYYLLSRLNGKEFSKVLDHNFLLRRLLIIIVNRLYAALEENEEVFREPERFDITWNLPLTLIFLSEVRLLNIYNQKIDIILKRCSSIVLSIYPQNYGNRLFLSVSLENVLQHGEMTKWYDHTILLKEGLETSKLLKQFTNKNILGDNGLAGISMILKIYNNIVEKYEFDHLSELITERIVKSNFWVDFENTEKIHFGNLGLLSGLAGVGMSLISDYFQN